MAEDCQQKTRKNVRACTCMCSYVCVYVCTFTRKSGWNRPFVDKHMQVHVCMYVCIYMMKNNSLVFLVIKDFECVMRKIQKLHSPPFIHAFCTYAHAEILYSKYARIDTYNVSPQLGLCVYVFFTVYT